MHLRGDREVTMVREFSAPIPRERFDESPREALDALHQRPHDRAGIFAPDPDEDDVARLTFHEPAICDA